MPLLILLEKLRPHTLLKVVVIYNNTMGTNTFFWAHNTTLFFRKLLLGEISDASL